jgi:hypothetical protein
MHVLRDASTARMHAMHAFVACSGVCRGAGKEGPSGHQNLVFHPQKTGGMLDGDGCQGGNPRGDTL